MFCIQKTTTKWGGFKYRTSETERQPRAKIVALDVASSVRALLKTSTTIRKEREGGGKRGARRREERVEQLVARVVNDLVLLVGLSQH